MEKSRSRLMHQLAWVFLFVFTATCTLFFFISIVPASLWWLPFAAFVVFEYGVLQWLDYHRHGTQNAYQWYISFIMVCLSVLAVSIATGLELIQWFTQAGLIHVDLWWKGYAVWAVVAVFPLNLVALIACTLVSPEHRSRYRELAEEERSNKNWTSPKDAGVNGHAPTTSKPSGRGNTPTSV